ncbi:hypothetical protein PAECIP111802_01680 [Paenibacillus allorhizosphaerae]|uniref:Uncharacterized protein n=1 Tax=Paenibacillus allorhizosphaerae TaxID=2849866 RepID=A0ABM8VEB8_9BACL|nr:hypothetical protein PAECIP111802_01680 [Paenibacillus allorhizosphaerae]
MDGWSERGSVRCCVQKQRFSLRKQTRQAVKQPTLNNIAMRYNGEITKTIPYL